MLDLTAQPVTDWSMLLRQYLWSKGFMVPIRRTIVNTTKQLTSSRQNFATALSLKNECVFRKHVLLIPLLATMLIASGCFESKVTTSKVNPASPGDRRTMNGVFYALPRTVVKVDIPIVRTNKLPGVLAVFTPCFLPDSDFVIRKKTSFAIDNSNVKFDTMFIPDTDEIYMIKTKGGMFETRNLELKLTESGVLIKASADVTNETIDIITGTIKTGSSLLAKALTIPLAAGVGLDAAQTACRAKVVALWEEELELPLYTFIDAAGNINEAALSAHPQIPEELKNVGKFIGGYRQADAIATEIEELETRRKDIISHPDSATPNVRAETLKLLIDELDTKIDDLKNTYFLGSESKLIWNPTFRFTPTTAVLTSSFFKLSKEHGVCAITVSQGVREDPRFKITKQCPGGAPSCKPSQLVPVACVGQPVTLALMPGEDGEGGAGGNLFANRVIAANLRQTGDRGFYYRIPARAIALLTHGPNELGRGPLSIAQLGTVVSLPASTGGRRTKYDLELYEASGGLKNFSLGSSALIQQKNIDDVAAGASSLIEAKGERNKAKAPADELQQLERQRKILEEKKKIRDLEKELTPGNDQTP
jgi:hypothetical protein